MKYIITIKLENGQTLLQSVDDLTQAQVLIEHFLKWGMVKEIKLKKKGILPLSETVNEVKTWLAEREQAKQGR